MVTTLIVLMVIAAILLIIVVLIQNPKGGGISSEFGGSGTNQMFGVQKTGDIVEKLTWGFFTFIVVAALSTAVLSIMGVEKSATDSDVNVEKAVSAPALPAKPSALPTSNAPAGLTAPTPSNATTTTTKPAEAAKSTGKVELPAPAPVKK